METRWVFYIVNILLDCVGLGAFQPPSEGQWKCERLADLIETDTLLERQAKLRQGGLIFPCVPMIHKVAFRSSEGGCD
jgi:hypothetical protein